MDLKVIKKLDEYEHILFDRSYHHYNYLRIDICSSDDYKRKIVHDYIGTVAGLRQHLHLKIGKMYLVKLNGYLEYIPDTCRVRLEPITGPISTSAVAVVTEEGDIGYRLFWLG